MTREALKIISGRAYPLGLRNVDTDIIISSEWLKVISRTGLGQAAFAVLRADTGNVFDDPTYQGSPILIAGDNFGCGSSREHAAWAMVDMGIKAIIAPSFSDIFSGNAFRNGIATIVLPPEIVDRLLILVETEALTISLEKMTITSSQGIVFDFEMDSFRRDCLRRGLDEVSLTLAQEADIELYETDRVPRSLALIVSLVPNDTNIFVRSVSVSLGARQSLR